MDSHYGQQEWLLADLEGQDLLYIADVPCDTGVWLELPRIQVPARKGNRGRKPTKLAADSQPTGVSQIASALEQGQWTRMYIRDTERGQLWSKLAFLRVYPVRDELPGPETWLILRKDEGEKKTEVSVLQCTIRYTFRAFGRDVPQSLLDGKSHPGCQR